MMLVTKATEALESLQPRWRVYVEGGSGHPETLVSALGDRATSSSPFEVVTSVMALLPRTVLKRTRTDST